MTLPQGPNQRWSLDFLSDAFADGRRFRILAIVDDFTRECLALVPDTSLPGLRVVRELDALIAARGRPAMCVSDNGTELTSNGHPALVTVDAGRMARCQDSPHRWMSFWGSAHSDRTIKISASIATTFGSKNNRKATRLD